MLFIGYIISTDGSNTVTYNFPVVKEYY